MSDIYSAFDAWLQRPSWHTSHPIDRGFFHRAMAEVCLDPGFTLDGLSQYIMKKGWGETLGFPIDKERACQRYVELAAEIQEHYRALRER